LPITREPESVDRRHSPGWGFAQHVVSHWSSTRGFHLSRTHLPRPRYMNVWIEHPNQAILRGRGLEKIGRLPKPAADVSPKRVGCQGCVLVGGHQRGPYLFHRKKTQPQATEHHMCGSSIKTRPFTLFRVGSGI
jgi:hypothetical protein